MPGILLGNTWRAVDKQSKFHTDCQAEDLAGLSQWCLYCVFDKAAGAVKVGTSARPIARLSEIQMGNPNPLYLGIVVPLRNDDGTFVSSPEALRLERNLHDKLSHLRMKGGTEWFRQCDEQRRIVELHWSLKGSIDWSWAS